MDVKKIDETVESFVQRLQSVFNNDDDESLYQILESAHPNIHAFVTAHPFRLDGKAEFERVLRSRFGLPGQIQVGFHQPAVEVYGPTAVVLTYFQIDGTTASGVNYSRYGQFSATFIEEDGEPRLVALHTAPLLEGATVSGLRERAYAGLASLGRNLDPVT